MIKILTRATQLNKSIKDLFESYGISYEIYMQEINNLINTSDISNIRKSIANLALKLSLEFEDRFEKRLPYLYGGGHKNVFETSQGIVQSEFVIDGINPLLGSQFTDEQKEKYKHKDGTIYNCYSYDCSSFLMLLWKLVGLAIIDKTASNMFHGYVSETYDEIILPMGKIYLLGDFDESTLVNKEYFPQIYEKYNSDKHNIQIGDILYTTNHVILISGVNGDQSVFETVEEKSGGIGMIRSIMAMDDINNGKYGIISIDEFIKNPDYIVDKYSLEFYKSNEEYISKGESQNIR